MQKRTDIIYPQNKNFAFTIFDDTDYANIDNVKPIYDYLYDLGLLTTKSIWLNFVHKVSMSSNMKFIDLFKEEEWLFYEVNDDVVLLIPIVYKEQVLKENWQIEKQLKDENICDGVHIMAIGMEDKVPIIMERAGLL